MTSPRRSWVGALAATLLFAGCSRDENEPVEPVPRTATAAPEAVAAANNPGARPDLIEQNRRIRATPRTASDGSGRAWIEGDLTVRSGVPRSFHLRFEVGPHGIATGGSIVFRLSPKWDTPQLSDPTRRGYVRIEARDDVELHAEAGNLHSIVIRNAGRALRPGEPISIRYGTGAPGSEAPGASSRNAETNAHFWLEVDGDGDGVRSLLAESPRFDVLAGPPSQIFVTLPATAHPGDEVILRIAGLDANLNSAALSGEVLLSHSPSWFEIPSRASVDPDGFARVRGVAHQEGIVRLRVSAQEIRGESNPMSVSTDQPRIVWADVHGHSQFSDGAGTPADYLRYAREVSGLDVSALTDHDYWGVQPLDQHPEHWDEIRSQTELFHDPGQFVTLLGFEWTHWIHGHRHVLYFFDPLRSRGSEDANGSSERDGELFSALDPRYETPALLWDALRGMPALTFAHHSAGRPIGTNWAFAPDPVLEPLTEIASILGSSESRDTPWPVDFIEPAQFVREQLDRGRRLGFVGGSDDHNGHPGSPRSGRPPGGLAAIFTEELTRGAVLEAMRARRTYATNGPRILLRVTLDSHQMGEDIAVPAEGRSAMLSVTVSAMRALDRIDVIRSGKVQSIATKGARLDLDLRMELDRLQPGEYVYVRAVQRNGGTAWSSPFFLTGR